MRENGNGKQTSAWKHIGTIARREFWTTVRRREFLLMTFGLPILYLVIGAISGLATASTMSGASSKAKSRVIGFYDQSGKLDRATLEAKKDDGGVVGQVFVDEKTGQAALKAKKIRSFVVVSEDYLKSHAVTVYLPASVGSAFSSNRERAGGYAELMKRALLAGKVQPIIAESVLADTNSTTRVYNEKTGVFEKPNLIREIGKFAVPYIFSLLLLLAVIFSSSYLVHGIVDEKENRIIEVLLSAVSHEELLAGKLLGLGGVGLLQLGLWLCTGSGVTLFFGLQVLQSLGIGWDTMGVAALMFLFGYALYASLMVGVGSLGTSWKESQQMTGVAVSFLVAPFLVIPAFLESPNGPLARTMSLFPLTAPISMMLRTAAGGGSVWEVALAVALLALTTWGAVLLAARLLRLSLLMYGQRPDFKTVWRWLTVKG